MEKRPGNASAPHRLAIMQSQKGRFEDAERYFRHALELAPEDPDMMYSILYALYDQGEMFTALEPGEAVAMGDLNYPFMPPFVGTEEEMEALVDFIASLTAPEGEAAAKGGV